MISHQDWRFPGALFCTKGERTYKHLHLLMLIQFCINKHQPFVFLSEVSVDASDDYRYPFYFVPAATLRKYKKQDLPMFSQLASASETWRKHNKNVSMVYSEDCRIVPLLGIQVQVFSHQLYQWYCLPYKAYFVIFFNWAYFTYIALIVLKTQTIGL